MRVTSDINDPEALEKTAQLLAQLAKVYAPHKSEQNPPPLVTLVMTMLHATDDSPAMYLNPAYVLIMKRLMELTGQPKLEGVMRFNRQIYAYRYSEQLKTALSTNPETLKAWKRSMRIMNDAVAQGTLISDEYAQTIMAQPYSL